MRERNTNFLRDLAAQCPGLTRLHITDSTGLSDTMLADLGFQQLEGLSLAGCRNVTYMTSLFSSRLKAIDLSATGISDVHMFAVSPTWQCKQTHVCLVLKCSGCACWALGCTCKADGLMQLKCVHLSNVKLVVVSKPPAVHRCMYVYVQLSAQLLQS